MCLRADCWVRVAVHPEYVQALQLPFSDVGQSQHQFIPFLFIYVSEQGLMLQVGWSMVCKAGMNSEGRLVWQVKSAKWIVF